MTIIQNPRQFKVPDWMLNRKKDVKDGKFSQVVSNTLDMKLREDLERLKKIRAHRGLRHYCAPPPPTGEHGTEGGWPAAGRACSSRGGSAASSLLGHQAVCGSPVPPLTPAMPLLPRRGPARAWPADEDHGPQGPHRRCVQEEGLDAITCTLLPQGAGGTIFCACLCGWAAWARAWYHTSVS